MPTWAAGPRRLIATQSTDWPEQEAFAAVPSCSMLITPRYEGPAVLQVDRPATDPAAPLLRQRRRLADELAGLDPEQWAAPSRCEGWSVQDVVAHLIGTNQFWALSISSGLAGSPTRYLASFDPVVTPRQMVDGLRGQTPDEVLAGFVQSNDVLAGALADVKDGAWSTPAEAPPGHIAIHAVVLHALWDSWVHERDVLLPLGIACVEEPDEVTGSLRYAAALGLALLAAGGSERVGWLAVEATDPELRFVVEAGTTAVVHDGAARPGAACLRGPAVDLVESLSFRVPFDHELDDADRWLLGGLAVVFDRTD